MVLGALGSPVDRWESWRRRPGFAPCELRGRWPLPPAFLFIGVGSVNIASKSKDALLGRHFEHQVRVVRYSHELGERWSTKDGMVSTLKVRDHEVNVVSAKVVWIAKLHKEHDLPERYGALSRKDALELCIVRLEISLS
jgi:hypothetical protein